MVAYRQVIIPNNKKKHDKLQNENHNSNIINKRNAADTMRDEISTKKMKVMNRKGKKTKTNMVNDTRNNSNNIYHNVNNVVINNIIEDTMMMMPSHQNFINANSLLLLSSGLNNIKNISNIPYSIPSPQNQVYHHQQHPLSLSSSSSLNHYVHQDDLYNNINHHLQQQVKEQQNLCHHH